MQSRVSLLFIRSKTLRDSLTTLLLSIPRISAVKHVDSMSAALRAISIHQPALIILDAHTPGGQIWQLIKRIRTRWPYVRCVVLTDSIQFQQRAIAAGAHQALLKGYPAAKLSVTIERMLR